MPFLSRQIQASFSPLTPDLPLEWPSSFSPLLAETTSKALLDVIGASSPFLLDCLKKEEEFVISSLNQDLEFVFHNILNDVALAARGTTKDTDFMFALRQGKRRAALLTAWADLAGWWDLKQVTGRLTRLAETAVESVAEYLLLQSVIKGDIIFANPDHPTLDSGLVILGMGKLGGSELNYSSDIDLMIFFDPSKAHYQGSRSLQEFYVRFARDLVRFLQDRTQDGYVFRTDLRLRPDPSSTPLAMSVNAAETYYESVGQNWERAAMIKARPIAGDLVAGQAFLARLRPFIWRKHLDFAAVQDIHSIKRQIHAVKGHRVIALAGHDVKIGRGGIREIEFFAQTQQLIWGGRIPVIRLRATYDALSALAERKIIPNATAQNLDRAYRFLRKVEHRLQMVEDRQTHQLPKDPPALEKIARFCGFSDLASFSAHLTAEMGVVEDHYADLFEESPSLGSEGNLVFTGPDDDPDTIGTLKKLGFKQPPVIAATVRGWHMGRYRAMRSARARELLTELIPSLLAALARTNNPDRAFHRFDQFLQTLPAGVQLLSLLRANPQLLGLFADCLGDAPLLAERMARSPILVEALFGLEIPMPSGEELAADLAQQTRHTSHFEEKLTLFHQWGQEQQFRAALRFLKHTLSAAEFGQALALIADLILCTLTDAVLQEFSLTHGHIPNGRFAILGLGKLGSREMTLTSDLDLIFLFDAKGSDVFSDGKKPLPLGQYYARLSQRIINALSIFGLYHVDMRLRPSGSNGPIASHLSAFSDYQMREAWTWEHMALTRARPVYGSPEFCTEITREVDKILAYSRDAEKLRQDVLSMRERVAEQFPPTNKDDLKHCFGGDMDSGFLVQYLRLRNAAETPAILHWPLDKLAKKFMPDLYAPYSFLQAYQQYRRLVAPGAEDIAQATTQLFLAKCLGLEDFKVLVKAVEYNTLKVYKLFNELIGPYGGMNEPANRG